MRYNFIPCLFCLVCVVLQQIQGKQLSCIDKIHCCSADSDIVWKSYDAFNRIFLDTVKGIYKTDTSFKGAEDRYNGAAAVWCQAIYWDMAMNAYKRAKAQQNQRREVYMRKLCRLIFEGNKKHYAGFDFNDNNENTGWFIYDDIMWWSISLARAYELFGDAEYLKLAEESFERVWHGSGKVGDTGSYDSENGGMFWQWQPIQNPRPNKFGDGKMACINFPTVIAALTIHNGLIKTGQEDVCYLQKGKEIYAWATDYLFDSEIGKVADSQHGDCEPHWKAHLYNQATFIGASVLLYQATGKRKYLDNACCAADYVFDEMVSKQHILPFECGPEQGIYTAIFAQYIFSLIYDCHQTRYLAWMEKNCLQGWLNRNPQNDICHGRFDVSTTDEVIDSYSASGLPAMLLLLPIRSR